MIGIGLFVIFYSFSMHRVSEEANAISEGILLAELQVME